LIDVNSAFPQQIINKILNLNTTSQSLVQHCRPQAQTQQIQTTQRNPCQNSRTCLNATITLDGKALPHSAFCSCTNGNYRIYNNFALLFFRKYNLWYFYKKIKLLQAARRLSWATRALTVQAIALALAHLHVALLLSQWLVWATLSELVSKQSFLNTYWCSKYRA
jgi:hypothetical protein